MKQIILASNSPRRKELLKELDYDFIVIPSNIEETINNSKEISEEIKRLSYEKAYEIFKKHEDAIVIGADTVVVKNNIILGKPKNKKEAKDMIELLNNSIHTVITGVTIMSKEMSETFSTKTDVEFCDMNKNEIDEYIKNDEILDKAGAYAIQGEAKRYIKSINGDFYTVVGLPICELNKRLKKYNG